MKQFRLKKSDSLKLIKEAFEDALKQKLELKEWSGGYYEGRYSGLRTALFYLNQDEWLKKVDPREKQEKKIESAEEVTCDES